MQCWVTGSMLGCHTWDGKGKQIFSVMGVRIVCKQCGGNQRRVVLWVMPTIGMGRGASGVAVSRGTSPCWDTALGRCARRVRARLGDRVHGRLGVNRSCPLGWQEGLGITARASYAWLWHHDGTGGVILFPCVEYLPSEEKTETVS